MSVDIFNIMKDNLGFIGEMVYKYWYRTRPVHKLWGLKNGEIIYLVTGKAEIKEDLSIKDDNLIMKFKDYYILKQGDFKAVLIVVATLANEYKNVKLKNCFSQEFPADVIADHNIICIGGPFRNTVTKHFMGTITYQLKFDEGDGHLIDLKNNKHYHPQEKDGFFEKDYGVIIKDQHPSQPNKEIFIIAGCHTEGVIGAARCISSLDRAGIMRIRKISKNIGKKKFFSFAIEVTAFKDEMGEIDVSKIEIKKDTLTCW